MNEKLDNRTFPFSNFEAFKKAISDGSVLLVLTDIGTATHHPIH
jgi:hypothetical protein